jgi:hypothetical protein
MSQAGIITSTDNNPAIPTVFHTNSGDAIPSGNALSVLGAAGTLTSGSGSTITITVSGSGMTWQTITASQTLVKDHGYFCISPGGALVLTLPTAVSTTIGDEITVSLQGATSWQIACNTGQTITIGEMTTSSGGSLTSQHAGDTTTIVALSGTSWIGIDSIGTFIFA